MDTYSQISKLLERYIIPFIIVCGFVSNTISFLVMRRIKKSSTAKYMTILALIDSGVLIVGGLNRYVNTSNFSSRILFSTVVCKLSPFMFYSFADFSVFIIVLMTFERFYCVWRPLEASKLNQTKLFRLNLLLGCFFCCLINCHFMFSHSLVSLDSFKSDHIHESIATEPILTNKSSFTDHLIDSSSSSNYACEYVIWKDFYEIYWIFIDSFIYSFLPSLIILTLNILIIKMLNKANRTNKSLSGSIKIQTKKSQYALEMVPLKRSDHRPRTHLSKSFQYIKSERHSFNSLRNLLENILNVKTIERFQNFRGNDETNKLSLSNDSLQSKINILRKKNSFNQPLKTGHNKSIRCRRNSKILSKRLIAMLITINISFCLFSMPMAFLQIISFSDLYGTYEFPNNENLDKTNSSEIQTNTQQSESLMDFWHQIAELLQFLNHGSSFILYSTSGKIFRNETKAFFRDFISFIKKVFCSIKKKTYEILKQISCSLKSKTIT